MVGSVLAREREAFLLDPGSALGTGSATGAGSGADPGATSGAGSASGAGADTGATSGAGSASSADADPGAGSRAPRPPAPDPLFGILGPGLLAAIGAAGIGLGVWATLDPTCSLRGASGTCLRGEENNVGLGILFIATGALSLAGAIIWWVTGAAAPPTEPRVDIVIGPGSAGVRGSF
jgi:hypothetical protein